MSDTSRTAVRVTVDPELCMGSGTCLAVAASLFDMSDDGIAQPLQSLVDGNATLAEAVSRCPTGAIGVKPAMSPA